MMKRFLSDAYAQARLAHRRHVFAKAFQKVIEDPLAQLSTHPERLGQLVYGWNNEAWSADQDYLNACIGHATEASGPFLECGSGLSTIILGAIADSQGKRLHALEHSSEWMIHVQNYLEKYSIDSVTIHLAPLRRYSDFEWYDAPIQLLPKDFDLVICDGPPGATLGGRFGLLPIMWDSLKDGCVILLDDADRTTEQAIVERWHTQYGVEVEAAASDEDRFAVISLPSR